MKKKRSIPVKLDKLTVLKILGIGDILLLGPAKPVAAGGRGGLAAQYPVAASPRLLHGVRAEHPNALF